MVATNNISKGACNFQPASSAAKSLGASTSLFNFSCIKLSCLFFFFQRSTRCPSVDAKMGRLLAQRWSGFSLHCYGVEMVRLEDCAFCFARIEAHLKRREFHQKKQFYGGLDVWFGSTLQGVVVLYQHFSVHSCKPELRWSFEANFLSVRVSASWNLPVFWQFASKPSSSLYQAVLTQATGLHLVWCSYRWLSSYQL